MNETYTCLCGHQEFYIDGYHATITCGGCGRTHLLMIEDNLLEDPEDFNKRINKESADEKH